jgi:L-fuculose-phosphate aldolase
MRLAALVAQRRADIAAACRRLHARGLLAGTEGNLSCRLPDGTLLITASGVDKGAAEPADVLHLHADGTLRHDAWSDAPEGNAPARERRSRPSSELLMHLACYAARADVQAIVHAHPPAATGFAAAGCTLPANVLPELPVVIGPVALVPYGRPGTVALGAAMQPYLASHDVFLLANHGVTVVGSSLTDAVLRMESVEQSARILLVARLLGGATPLPAAEAEALAALRAHREPHAVIF